MPSRSFIVGTAGHIDHGKTALVRALTGTDTDRLKEEKRRGITIELGFAHLLSDDGRLSFGIVDVPGHERFIKSMVAGAGGIDLVMLIIAADEGVMPQTREHLDICDLLGVRRGLVALTKSDLVDPEWLALVKDDVQKTLEKSFLAEAPIIACSAPNGDGVATIKETLIALADQMPDRDADGLLRMPLDRVFSMKGFGTVVTGPLLSGSIRPGDEVAVLPSAVTSTVRRVQVHGQAVERAVAGQRTAINLGGVDRQAVARGEVLAAPQTLAPSRIIDVSLEILPSARQRLKSRSKVLFHLGTRQQEASCILLDQDELLPGGSALAQLRFEKGVVALPADRFILRGFAKQENYGTTLGGGSIVRVLSRKIKRAAKSEIALLGEVARAKTADERLALEILWAGPGGIDRADVQRRVAIAPKKLDQIIGELLTKKRIVRFDRDAGAVVHIDHFTALKERMLAVVDQFHQDNALRSGISRAELHSRLPQPVNQRLFFALLSSLEKQSALIVEKEHCRRPEHSGRVEASLGPLSDRIVGLLDQAGLKALREAEVAEALAADKKELAAALRLLIANATILRIDTLLFHQQHVAALEQRLLAFLAKDAEITPGQFKELVGQSRKFFIPLAEYFDAKRVTVRVGDVRKAG